MRWLRPSGPDDPSLADVAAAIRSGDAVAVPTETVYGLAANALEPEAVLRVCKAKGRPTDNPIGVLLANARGALAVTAAWPDEAQRLAAAFWPGPLTIVLPKAKGVPEVLTAGLPSVGVRVPDQAVTRRIIELAGVPLTASSANLSGGVSPSRAEDIVEQLRVECAYIVDCGPCALGIESTVLDLTADPPVILRLGALSEIAIAEALGIPVSTARREPGGLF